MCEHKNVLFVGLYSLIGNYVCQDCKAVIEPVEYHKSQGNLHVDLIDYYTENPDKLDPRWRDYPCVL